MILRDGDERLILNMRHDTSSYSNKPKKESINMIDIYNVSHKDYLEDLFANEKATNHQSGNPTFSSHTDLTSPKIINPLSGNPTLILEPVAKSSSFPTLTSLEESDLIWEEFEAYLASDSFPPGNDDPVDLLLEEFADELALITFPPGNDCWELKSFYKIMLLKDLILQVVIRLWIESYIQLQDYALWEIIEEGNSFKPVARTTTNEDGTSTTTIPGPVTDEQKILKKNDLKARSILMMTLPSEHLLTFNKHKDAKSLFEAIEARFGGNEATKKTQKTLLKQMYETFNASSSESLDSIFNRLQKIVSQLTILGENITPEELNLKFLRSLPTEWGMHVVVWRNKSDLGSISFDDLYNNFKIVEPEVKRSVTSSSNSGSQNLAFVSGHSSTNDVNTANVHVSTGSTPVSTASTNNSTACLSDATVYAYLATQPNGSQVVHEDLEQIHEDDLDEMDLKWQLALLSMKARKFYQRTGKKIIINGSDTAGYDKKKVECFNCHKLGHFARECRNPRSQENRSRSQDSSRRTVNVEESSSKAMLAIDGTGFDWSYMADEEASTNFALMAFSDSEVQNNKTCSKTCLKNFEDLKSKYDKLRIELNKSESDLDSYKKGLASVEEQLVFYKKNESMLCDQIAVLKRDADCCSLCVIFCYSGKSRVLNRRW
ncbi:putative ribonuclease H-like domain-containing protein [Tanacetum coccineum]